MYTVPFKRKYKHAHQQHQEEKVEVPYFEQFRLSSGLDVAEVWSTSILSKSVKSVARAEVFG